MKIPGPWVTAVFGLLSSKPPSEAASAVLGHQPLALPAAPSHRGSHHSPTAPAPGLGEPQRQHPA